METHSTANAVNRQRRAGILLHPTSLPGPLGHGDFGHQAYRFIEFLNTSGFKVWQMLPLGPTHDEKSPYQCLSSHAGNPLLISIDWLEDKGWLDRKKIRINLSEESHRRYCLQQAAEKFYLLEDDEWIARIEEFSLDHAYWLEDFALFMALKGRYKGSPWYDWPAPVLHRKKIALDAARAELHGVIRQTIFEQFVFFTQWQEIRNYAKQHDIELFGDMPIFIAKDSVDVWAQIENFLIGND
ncbi:MAG: 4-alpha-glucanotransferase, partial [Arenicellales bacterium]